MKARCAGLAGQLVTDKVKRQAILDAADKNDEK